MLRILMLAALVGLLLAGCSQSLYLQGNRAAEEGNYDRAVQLYYQEIAKNPESARAWRGLGVAFYEQGDLVKAEDALKQSNAIQPHPRTHLYIGMLHEKQGNDELAINAYSTALTLDPGGATKSLLLAHRERLLGQIFQREVAEALQQEDQLDISDIPENTIAVADFDGSRLPEQFSPIARGLAEFTAIDLAKVNQLRVVDRLKIETILSELQLSASGAVDPSTAPRMGKLLGTRHLVTATMLGVGDEIQIDGVLVNTADTSIERTETGMGDIKDIFRVQKEFVFDIIDDLGVTLTAEERNAIAEVPTESFLAFLSFSRGLEYQHQGRHGEAQSAFNEALQIDPGFSAAAVKAASAGGAAALGGGGHTFAAFEQMVVSDELMSEVAAGVDETISFITTNIGMIPNLSSFRPVEQPPIAAGTATVTVRGDLNGQ